MVISRLISSHLDFFCCDLAKILIFYVKRKMIDCFDDFIEEPLTPFYRG